ncbi:MAG: hypothetical protein PHR56_08830, partial [Dehalococcoidales bacterium]|nr:hypothetical protein [Dehalococcoidales bacterium]
MLNKKRLLSELLALLLLVVMLNGCGSTADPSVTFSQLISQANKYNGKIVTLEAFYFSGFEISALSESVGPASSGPWRIVPTGTLIWVEGGIPKEVYDKLYGQTATPSGYTERIGKLKITGKFETGRKYGHLDSYDYKITITGAELLEWTPPPAAGGISTGSLQIIIENSFIGKFLQGAKVVSERQPDGQLKVTGITNDRGIVTFVDIKVGEYKFFVSCAEYSPLEMVINVIGGQTTSAAFNMARIGDAPDDVLPAPGMGPQY